MKFNQKMQLWNQVQKKLKGRYSMAIAKKFYAKAVKFAENIKEVANEHVYLDIEVVKELVKEFWDYNTVVRNNKNKLNRRAKRKCWDAKNDMTRLATKVAHEAHYDDLIAVVGNKWYDYFINFANM